MIKRIHINQHIIKSNQKNGTKESPITLKMGGKNFKVSQLKLVDTHGNILGYVYYKPNKPLSCGASVWIEGNGNLGVIAHDNKGKQINIIKAIAEKKKKPAVAG